MRRLALIISMGLACPSHDGVGSRPSRPNHVADQCGSYAILTVAVSPARTCSITVYYKSGPSHAQGLYPKRGARISWTWKVETRTTPGRWPIVVSCGSAGTLRTSFVVR